MTISALAQFIDDNDLEYIPPIEECVDHEERATKGKRRSRRPAFPRWSDDPKKQHRREVAAFMAYLDYLTGHRPDGRRKTWRDAFGSQAAKAAEWARGLIFEIGEKV